MKIMLTKTVILAILLLSMTTYAEVIDLLKPEYQKKEQAVQKLMDKFMEKGITYDVKIVRKANVRGGLSRRGMVEYNECSITLPAEIADKVHALDRQVKNAMLFDYLEMDRYSFYAAVLMVEHCGDKFIPDVDAVSLGYVETTTRKQDMFDGIVKKDKKLWDAQLHVPLDFIVNGDEIGLDVADRKVRRDMFLDSYFKASGGGDSYKNAVLYESIPEFYYVDVFKTPNNICKGSLDVRLKKFSGGTLKGVALAFSRMHQAILYKTPLLHKWEEERAQDTQNFFKTCRENDPATKPYLSALMMGLFTVDGYAFNDETGVYTMNERGKMLMDFIVEFPIPENATRLQAVMNGGNKDEIEGMMKKHGTVEKWNELLKNPVHPEFAKYPLD